MIDIRDEDIDEIEVELNLTFDQARRNALKRFDDVQACPGSGKTTMVAAKLLIIAKKWTDQYQGVCVLTHTNVAKNEIISALSRHSAGQKLLVYPHFIGTIQEFVNKFMGIPILRSEGIAVNQIDDEICCSTAQKWLKYKTKAYLQRNRIESIQDLQYQNIDNKLQLNVPGFKKESTSESYVNLTKIKNLLLEKGLHFYQEMYVYSEGAIQDNPDLIKAIRARFPIVLIDEMQDTQKFQDEFLNKIFDDATVKFQRFGDPDQAIYGEKQDANETYNNQKLEKIVTSHRFTPCIATLAKKLSLNQIDLKSEQEETLRSMHTIFLIDDNTRKSVFKYFANICSKVVPIECEFPIKAVGAVGKFKEKSLTICDYYPSYEKSNSENSFRPKKFIHYFNKAKQLAKNENTKAYSLLIDGFVKCGQISGNKIQFDNGENGNYSKRSIKKLLVQKNIKAQFNTILLQLLDNEIDAKLWNESIFHALKLIGINFNDSDIKEFGAFTNEASEEVLVIDNKISFKIINRVIKVDVTTIHSVKGETHAATLVLENRYHDYDAEKILKYILGTNKKKPTAIREKKFLKQFYVGFTRPKHLLCLAMDKSRFPEEYIEQGKVSGWNIVDLTLENRKLK